MKDHPLTPLPLCPPESENTDTDSPDIPKDVEYSVEFTGLLYTFFHTGPDPEVSGHVLYAWPPPHCELSDENVYEVSTLNALRSKRPASLIFPKKV